MKPMTLKSALERMHNFPKDEEEKILNTIQVPLPENGIVYYPHKKDGKECFECYCPACGHLWNMTIDSHKRPFKAQCPKCGNKTFLHQMFVGATARLYLHQGSPYYMVPMDIDENEGYVFLEEYEAVFSYSRDHELSYNQTLETIDDNSFTFLQGHWELYPAPRKKIIFLKNKGLRFVSNDGTHLEKVNRDQDVFKDYFHSMNLAAYNADRLCAYASALTGKPCVNDTVLDELGKYTHELNIAEAPKKRTANSKNALLQYDLPALTQEDIKTAAKLFQTSVYSVMDTYGTKQKIVMYCGFCDSCFETEAPYRAFGPSEIMCPNCGRIHHIHNENQTSLKCMKFDLMPESGFLVERIFTIKFRINSNGITKSVDEEQRIYFTDKEILRYTMVNHAWRKSSKNESASYNVAVQTNDEIKALIKDSVLKYSGVIEAWGLGEEKSWQCESIGTCYSRSYLQTWYQAPYIEKTIKTGLKHVTQSIMNGAYGVADPEGSSVMQILGIERPVFNIVQKLDLNMHELSKCNALYSLDHSMTDNEYKTYTSLASADDFKMLYARFNIKPKRVLEYLQTCYDEQCIEKNEAFRIWFDYLRMASDLEYDLRDKSRKFPNSLKKEHDKASFAYKRVKNQISSKKLKMQYELHKGYEYEKGDFLIKIPKSAEEIISEATNQHNCLASYVNRVCEGQTTIAFVRRKQEPDRSYVTMEIRDDRIWQMYGYANHSVMDYDTLDFVRSFAVKNNLACNY